MTGLNWNWLNFIFNLRDRLWLDLFKDLFFLLKINFLTSFFNIDEEPLISNDFAILFEFSACIAALDKTYICGGWTCWICKAGDMWLTCTVS